MFKTSINSDKYLPRFHVSITVSLTVSALNSASKGLGSRPDRVIGLYSCVLGQDKLFSQCFTTNSQGCLIKYSRSRRLEERSSLAEDWHPYPGGSRDTPTRFMLWKPE